MKKLTENEYVATFDHDGMPFTLHKFALNTDAPIIATYVNHAGSKELVYRKSVYGIIIEEAHREQELTPELIIPYSSLIKYIGEKVRFLESKTKSVAVLQFTDAPQGMAMILRLYVAKYDKEYTFNDTILMAELDSFDSVTKEKERVDVLFDEIHKALNDIQIIPADKAKHLM